MISVALALCKEELTARRHFWVCVIELMLITNVGTKVLPITGRENDTCLDRLIARYTTALGFLI